MTAPGVPATARAPAPPRRRRWRWILGVLALLGLGGWWWIDRQLEPERLAATVLARLGSALELELTIDGTPDYALLPEPRLVLPGFVARRPGAATPLLTADRLEVSLPWATILDGETVVITRLQLDAPVLDVAALSAWLASRPESGEPFELPTLTRGLEIGDGRIVGAGWQVEALALALPALAPGAPVVAELEGRFVQGEVTIDFAGKLALPEAGLKTRPILQLAGRLRSGDTDLPWALQGSGALDATGESLTITGLALVVEGEAAEDAGAGAAAAPWQLSLGGDLARGANGTAIEGLRLRLQGAAALPELAGHGSLHVGDTIRLALDGQLTRWPDTWPVLPGPPVGADAALDWTLRYEGGSDLAAPLALVVERGDTRLDTRLTVPELRAWLAADPAGVAPLPPLAGTLETPVLEIGGATLEGVRVRILDEAGDAAAPADGPPADGTPAGGAPADGAPAARPDAATGGDR